MKESKSIYSILRGRYPAGEYVVMQEVSDMAGFYRSRSADFVIMSLWPSRGLSLTGIELKSSRSDWLSEKKKPEKAENIFQYCDYFYLLTNGDDIANIEEIPETWGWLNIKGSRVVVVKEAPKLTPVVITKHFLAALLKRASDKSNYTRTDLIQDTIDLEKDKVKNDSKRTIESLTSELKRANESISEFNNASGINLKYLPYKTTAKQVGEALKFIINGGANDLRNDLTSELKIFSETYNSINNTLKSINEIQNETISTNNNEPANNAVGGGADDSQAPR